MVYHARGRLLGDHFGPMRFAKVNRLLKKPKALHALLREFGADVFLVPGCGRRFRLGRTGGRWFRPIYARGGVCIYRLLDPEKPAAGGRPKSRSGLKVRPPGTETASN